MGTSSIPHVRCYDPIKSGSIHDWISPLLLLSLTPSWFSGSLEGPFSETLFWREGETQQAEICTLLCVWPQSVIVTLSSSHRCRKVMSAPNLLRVGTAEQIFVECQDCTGGDIDVSISVWSHPTKDEELANTAVTLNAGNHFQQLGRITVIWIFWDGHCVGNIFVATNVW